MKKFLKYIFCFISIVAIFGVIAAFALIYYSNDKVETAPLTFVGIDMNKISTNEFIYKGKVHFERLDILLRSKTISNIDIIKISWIKDINSSAVKDIQSHNRILYFASSQKLSDLNISNLGEIKFKMNFLPLLKTTLKYYLTIIVLVLILKIAQILLKEMFLNLEFKESIFKITKYMIFAFFTSLIVLFIFRFLLLCVKQ